MSLLPTNNNQLVGPVNDGQQEVRQPRQPANFHDLLRYAAEVSSQQQSSSQRPPTELDEEKRQFLENVFKNLTVNVIKELCEALETLKTIQSTDVTKDVVEYEDALDKIADFIDNIDFANDFHKIGGFQVICPCLSYGHASIRWRTADVIAQCCQNNPYCQRMSLEMGLLETLLHMSENDIDETCRVKAFYAVACIVRDFQPAFEKFSSLDGFSCILRLVCSDTEKLRIKSTFFLSSILSQHPEVKDGLCKMGFVERLAILAKESGPCREHVLSCLASFLDDCPSAVTLASSPTLGLYSYLSQLIEECSGKAAQQEEVEYAKRILALLSNADSDTEMEK